MTKEKALAYRSADGAANARIPNEQVELTGWHRGRAKATLREALVLTAVKPRLGQTPVYGPNLQPPLNMWWAVLRAPDSRLLDAMLPVLVPLLRHDEELAITDPQAELLMRMSAGAFDKELAAN